MRKIKNRSGPVPHGISGVYLTENTISFFFSELLTA